MRKSTWPWLLGCVFVAGACFLLLAGRTAPLSSRDLSGRGFQILGTVIELIKYDYVEEPNPARTMDGAFRGLVDSLDVLSTYLNPEGAAKYRLAQTQPFKDVGVVLIKAYGSFPQVVGVLEGSPAAEAGIKPGDYLSSIGDVSTLGFSLIETELALKNRGDEPVRVKIVRQEDNKEITVKRAVLPGKPVWVPAAGPAVVLRVPKLFSGTADAVRDMISKKLKGNANPLILDLRNCDEGDAGEAARLVNLFLQSETVGYFLKRHGAQEPVGCPQKAAWDKLPLAVWTNAGTQGPAEIAAGVLQDARRAKVVGGPTPGLAAVTEILPLRDGSALVLTTGIFALSSGRKIWGQGLKPDVPAVVRDAASDDILKKTLELFLPQ